MESHSTTNTTPQVQQDPSPPSTTTTTASTVRRDTEEEESSQHDSADIIVNNSNANEEGEDLSAVGVAVAGQTPIPTTSTTCMDEEAAAAGVVAMVDRHDSSCGIMDDDLEVAALPVIELPSVYENVNSTTCPPTMTTTTTTAMASVNTTVAGSSDGVVGDNDGRDVTESSVNNNNTATIAVIEGLTTGVVEAPLEGTMTLADLEAAPIAHLVKGGSQQQVLYDCGGGGGGTMTAVVADTEYCYDVEQQNSDTSSQAAALPVSERRAEFISATILKTKNGTTESLTTMGSGDDEEVVAVTDDIDDEKDVDEDRNNQHDPLGMDLISNEKGDVLISRIDPGSLIARTPFQVGDRLLSVNQKRCYVMDAKDVVQFMATLEGSITIVVHNEGGNPNFVESMITKPSPDHRCGLGLASSGRQHLKISSIDAGGLFFDTLLNVGDPVVSINGEECEICDAQDAGDMIARAGIYITIKARTMLETGVVVAAFSSNNSTGSNIPPEVIHALNPDNHKTPTFKQLAALTAMAVLVISLLFVTGGL